MVGMGMGRPLEEGRPETTLPALPSGQGSSWTWAMLSHGAGRVEARSRGRLFPRPSPARQSLGRVSWWPLQAVAIVPYLELLALTPRPQRPLESGAMPHPPQTDGYGFRCLGRGQGAVSLINHFRPPWETH